MRFFFSVKAQSPLERLLRTLAMLGVIALVGWAFWMNNQRMVRTLNIDKEFWDATNSLSDQDQEFVREFLTALAEQYGVRAVVHVRKGEPELPDSLGPEDFFLGVSPVDEQVLVRLPARMNAPEDQDFATYLTHDHFVGNWAQWQRGLKTALVMAWEFFAKNGPAPKGGEGGLSLSVEDRTGRLTDAALKGLDGYGRDLNERFGQRLKVVVYDGPVDQPDLDETTLYLGLSPTEGLAMVRLPAMMERVLGPDFAQTLADDLLNPALAQGPDGPWPDALRDALGQIWLELAGEERAW